ncbi:metallophosphoesterase [Urechidicola vernalis]|uniref:Metallophosphoesterase n=1 Tax=Urechidicola vernalis TaxID=3075600 RepID=A0ABU2Y6I3_9FLAO|nr:metallophosphoesterase [Urechidicola sp. P050]MDT0553421.1 metallophosphoesterase [Urechidicola sp. P050]
MQYPKRVVLLITCLVAIGLISFTNTKPIQNKLDYSGTNGLFIEYKDGLQIKWITNKEDSGHIILRTLDNTVIKKGQTSSSRSHSFNVNHTIDEPIFLEIGGENSEKQTIKLRPKSKLENAIYRNVDSIYVVGDVHGRYNQLTNLLQKSNLINSDLEWIGGKAHLVFLGDLFDRGDDVTKVLWFIYELEEKARLKGGKVHVVLGNHEIMVMSKDLRYLSRKEASIPFAHGVTYDYLFHPNKSLLGTWLSKKASVIKIDNAILAHGGIVDLGNPSINDFNKTTAEYIQKEAFLDLMEEHADSTKYEVDEWETIRNHFYHPDSPFWYRGYVYQDTLAPQLNAMLRKYKAKLHVVAHTPQETITERYKGKLLTTDLNDAATELLLLVRDKKKYKRFKSNSLGEVSKLN